MKRKVICFVALMTMTISALYADYTLPTKAMGKPKVFMDEKRSYEWEDIVKKKNWGDTSDQIWRVYIDRDGVKSYASPNTSSQVIKKDLKFMEPYYVAEIKGNFALLFEQKYLPTNLQIENGRSVGWVELDKLLLWTSCPRNRSQIYRKAVILKDLEDIQSSGDLQYDEVSPFFSTSPTKLVKRSARANRLEFYFLYKYDENGAALLFRESKIDNLSSLTNETHFGWMFGGNYTSWDDRVCYEPKFDSPDVAYEAAIFKNGDSAFEYKRTGAIGDGWWWHEKLPAKRWPAKRSRFPVLYTNNTTHIHEVGTIGYLSGTDEGSSVQTARAQKELDEISEKLDALQKKMNQINVVFVIDGTKSMRDFYMPVANAIKDAMKQDVMRGVKIRFGAVVYRNYADGDKVVEEKPLTDNATDVASWLLGRECNSKAMNTHYEAVYHGLTYAIDNMKWSKDNTNFLVHIGDAGNVAEDEKGYTIETVSRKMADKYINYIGFQVNNYPNPAYDDFASQIRDITTEELKCLLNGRIVRPNEYTEKENRLKEFTTNIKGNQNILMATYFVNRDQPAEPRVLKDLIERKITEFNEMSAKDVQRYRSALDNMTADGSWVGDVAVQFLNIDQFLMEKGFTESQIKKWKQQNMVIKVRGFTSRTAGGKDVFTPCVFMANDELNELIDNLQALSKQTTQNRRKDLQKALEGLALVYLGESKGNELTVDEITKAVSGLQDVTGKKALGSIKLKDLESESKVPGHVVDGYIDRIKKDLSILKKRQKDSRCYFESLNGNRYYYILMEDMPMQKVWGMTDAN